GRKPSIPERTLAREALRKKPEPMRAARRLQRVLGPPYDARVFVAAVKADTSISTLSLTIRSTHLSTGLSWWSFARKAARAARSAGIEDRKSTRLNSSHVSIAYAVLCF